MLKSTEQQTVNPIVQANEKNNILKNASSYKIWLIGNMIMANLYKGEVF